MKFKKIIVIIVVYMHCHASMCKSVQISTRTLHNVSPTQPSEEASNFIDGPCFDSLHCVHGRCRRRDGETQEFLISECLCEPHWTGLVCDQRQIIAWPSSHRSTVNLDVADGEGTTKGTFKTVKDYGNEGNTQHGQGVDDEHQYTTQGPSDVFKKGIESTKDDITNICGANYKPRSIEERSCTPGLLCRFGTCSVDHKGSYIAYNCHCDKGAIGIFCEHQCCLECGEHGSCQLFENGTQFCNCMRGYSGEQCQYGQPAQLTLGNDHYHWAVIVGVLIAASFVFLTAITTFFIWRRWLGGKIAVLDKLNCKSNKDTHYQYDVSVWYDNNDADENFVKQVLLPLLEQSALTFCLHAKSETEDNQEEAEETIQRVINKSYKHIIVYTSKFVQNCPKRVDMLLIKHNRMLQNRLVCLYRHRTNKIVDHIRNRLFRIIFRNVYIPLPDICNESEVSSVKESLRTQLPPKTISKKLSIGNISV